MSTFPPIADYGFLSNCEQSCLVAPEGSRVFRTAATWLIHAAGCSFRYAMRASYGVWYPIAE